VSDPAADAPAFQTADLCDAHGEEIEIALPLFAHFGGSRRFHGPISTITAFEDNRRVRETLGTAGSGRVLVVDGAGSTRVALLGDQLAKLAIDNGWVGIMVYGCVRDSEALAQMPLGVLAVGTCPLRSRKEGTGSSDMPVRFAGLTFRPGQHLYADPDGVVLANRDLLAG